MLKYLFLILLLVGCTDQEELTTKVVNDRLSAMYEEIASCDELAKCMGGTKGYLYAQSYPFMTVEGIYRLRTENLTCRIETASRARSSQTVMVTWSEGIELKEIKPMLEGCRRKSCPDEKCEK